MPRSIRINYPDACYHVMNRGSGRQKIFRNNVHRMMFMDLLNEAYKMFDLKVFAYCLMDNHYHLLVSTPDANLARIMRHINGVYTQRYNRLQKTDGPLFRGRYRAILIGDDCYQLILSRYIHLNPVKAKIVNNPADYEWSSYRAYLGLLKSPEWLFKDEIINQLAETKSLSHVRNYRHYVEESDMEEINTYSSIKYTDPILGSELFKEKILSGMDVSSIIKSCSSDLKRVKKIPSIDLIIDHVCLYYDINREVLMHHKSGSINWPKSISIYISRKCFGYFLKDISKIFGFYRYEAVSAAIHQCYLRLQKHPELLDEINTIVDGIRHQVLEGQEIKNG